MCGRHAGNITLNVASISQECNLSFQRHFQKLGLSKTTWRILKEKNDLGCYLYKIVLIQKLKPWRKLADFAFEQLENEHKFFIFHLSGVAKKQNFRFRGEKNPKN